MNLSTIWVVVPALNEATVIRSVLTSLIDRNFIVVLVNDGSTDCTQSVVENMGIHYLKHSRNRGQGASLQTGIQYALSHGAELIVTFDADGQHDAADIVVSVRRLLAANADIALGSRFLCHRNTIPWVRRLWLYAGLWFTHLRNPDLTLTDTHNGFRVFTDKAAKSLTLRHEGFAHASEILDWISHHGFRYIEVPVRVFYTSHSRKKSQGGLRRAIAVVFALYRRRRHRQCPKRCEAV